MQFRKCQHAETNTSLPVFQHENLQDSSDQIRLLTLWPARYHHQPVCCNLHTASLSVHEEYEALSYCWGKLDDRVPIYLNDGVFEVTRNLDTALRYLRYSKLPRTLWIDAICINQSHNDEKTAQVRIMHHVYQNAIRAVVWLGESTSDVQLALDYLSKSKPDSECIAGDEKLRQSLSKLYQRPWWRRVWTIQEIWFGSRSSIALCGKTALLFDTIGNGAVELHETRSAGLPPLQGGLHTVLTALVMTHKAVEGVGFKALLHATANHESSEPRDRCFALLNMDDSLAPGAFQSDYKMSLSDVNQKAMIRALHTDTKWPSKGSELLYNAIYYKSPGTPTWCIDFSQKGWDRNVINHDLGMMLYRDDAIDAGGGRSEFKFSHDGSEKALIFQGYIVGNITELNDSKCIHYQRLRQHCDSDDTKAAKLLYHELIYLLDTYYHFVQHGRSSLSQRLSESQVETLSQRGELWRIFADGLTEEFFTQTCFASDQNGFDYKTCEEFFQSHYLPWRLARRSIPEELCNFLDLFEEASERLSDFPNLFSDTSEDLLHVFRSLAFRGSECCYFSTDNGYTGRSAFHVQKNDVICIIPGCRRPAVIRKASADSCQLISFTWTHDLMHGEWINGPGAGRIQDIKLV